MLDTKIFDTKEVLKDRLDSINTPINFFKSTRFLFLLTIALTIVLALQTTYLLQGPAPLFALATLGIIAVSYFHSLRTSILLLLVLLVVYSLFTIYGFGSAFAFGSAFGFSTEYEAIKLSISFFTIQILTTLGSAVLATYSRIVKTDLKWQEKVKHFADTHDDLTALLNKESFIDRLNMLISEASGKQERFALVLIDINGLQKINQAYGYKAGNAALHIISDRLRQVAQKDDLIARIEDDCFALVVRNMAHNAQLKGYIVRVVAMLNLPFDYAWTAISLDTKVSSSFYPLDGKTAEELLTLNIEKLG